MMSLSCNEAGASALPAPKNRPGVRRPALWLTVAILGLLLFNERPHVFGTKLSNGGSGITQRAARPAS